MFVWSLTANDVVSNYVCPDVDATPTTYIGLQLYNYVTSGWKLSSWRWTLVKSTETFMTQNGNGTI